MKVTLIAEGSKRRQRIFRRWGISLLLGEDVLFDTFGLAYIFWRNLKRSKVDIQQIRHVIISHDDWDHIAGLEHLLGFHKDVFVYLCKESRPDLKMMVMKSGATLIEVDKPLPITDSIFSLGQMRSDTRHGVVYEQALLVKTGMGVSVISGCAHPGIDHILESAVEQSKTSVSRVIGGFHMKDNESSRNKDIVSHLKESGVTTVVPLHCTGYDAVKVFKSYYGDRCILLKEGACIPV